MVSSASARVDADEPNWPWYRLKSESFDASLVFASCHAPSVAYRSARFHLYLSGMSARSLAINSFSHKMLARAHTFWFGESDQGHEAEHWSKTRTDLERPEKPGFDSC